MQTKYITAIKTFNKLLESEMDAEKSSAYYTAIDCILQVIAFEEAREARDEKR